MCIRDRAHPETRSPSLDLPDLTDLLRRLRKGRPALALKASANSGILTTTPLIRYLPGECGLVTAIRRRFSGRLFSDAHCAKPTKKRCSGVRPSLTSSFTPFVASFHAAHARIVPPRSAMSSPDVSFPLILMSSTTTYCEYSSRMQFARLSNSSPSFLVHQSRRLPSPSYWRPSSSKP